MIVMSNQQPLSDLEVRDALAALQQVPAAGLDEAKHETVTDIVDDAQTRQQPAQ